MLKLSKKVEYALMAVKYIAAKPDGMSATSKEISEEYDISYELLSKVLQRLSKFNIVKSYQGIKGGYSLSKSPKDISIIDIIRAIESNYKITNCMEHNNSNFGCERIDNCSIKSPLSKLQNEIDKLFNSMTIYQIM